jgi:hypothetical protein
MRRLPVSLLMLLTTACCASGQSEPRGQANTVHSLGTVFQIPATTDSGCPVGLIAERRSDMMMLRAEDTRRDGPAQGLYLIFNHRDQPQIESAEITVYGMSSKSRILPAGTPSLSDEVSKTFKLQSTKGGEGLQDTSVWMHRVGSLSWVELTSIAYADGTTWNKSKSSQCQAVPSALLLISSR